MWSPENITPPVTLVVARLISNMRLASYTAGKVKPTFLHVVSIYHPNHQPL